MAHVTVFGPGSDATGRAVPIDGVEVTLGRDPASDVVLDDYRVSRRHAVLRRGPSGWEVHDLGSSNGIRVQGHRMEAALLRDGDEIRVGSFRLVFTEDAVADVPCSPRRAPPPPPVPARPLQGRRAHAPPAPAGARRTRGGLLLTLLAAALLLPSLFVGVVLLSGRKVSPDTTADPPPVPTPAAPPLPDEPLPAPAPWPPPPDAAVKAEVDRAAASLEGALARGDVEEAFVHVHPAATESLRAAFEPRRAELPRVAALLSTRRLVVAEEAWAEYEVTEDGRSYSVVFEKVEGRWLLSWL